MKNGSFPFISELVEGEVANAGVLLLGPPGAGKSTYARQFLFDGLKNGEKCIILSTDEFPETIKSNIGKIGSEKIDFQNLFIIDCYSSHLGLKSTSPYLVSPRNLQQILIILQELIKSGSSRIVVDSVTTMAMHNGPGVGMQFLHLLMGWLRHEQVSGLFLLEAGVHDSGFLNFLRFMFDGVIEMTITEQNGLLKRAMRVFSLTGVKPTGHWLPFEISDHGIEL